LRVSDAYFSGVHSQVLDDSQGLCSEGLIEFKHVDITDAPARLLQLTHTYSNVQSETFCSLHNARYMAVWCDFEGAAAHISWIIEQLLHVYVEV